MPQQKSLTWQSTNACPDTYKKGNPIMENKVSTSKTEVPTMAEVTVVDVLENAAEIMEEWGWTHGEFLCKQGKMCEEGAVAASAGWHVHVQTDDGRWIRFNYDDLSYSSHKPLKEAGEVYSYDEMLLRNRLWTASLNALHAVGGGASHNDRTGNTPEMSVAKIKEAAAFAAANPERFAV